MHSFSSYCIFEVFGARTMSMYIINQMIIIYDSYILDNSFLGFNFTFIELTYITSKRKCFAIMRLCSHCDVRLFVMSAPKNGVQIKRYSSCHLQRGLNTMR